jgi:hypothetical protein
MIRRHFAIAIVLALLSAGLLLLAARHAAERAPDRAPQVPASIAEADTDQATVPDPAADADFADRLPQELAHYDQARLQALIDAENASQNERFGVNEAEGHYPSAGFVRYAQKDYGAYFTLERTSTETDHTDVIDTGLDRHETIFYAREPVTEIARLDGSTYPLKGPLLVLAVPSHDSCLGENVPDGSFSLHQLHSQQALYTGTLPPETFDLTGVGSPAAGVVSFVTTDRQSLSEIQQEGHTCEVGEWVKLTTRRFTLRCDPAGSNCRLSQQLLSATHGCEPVGACD